MVQLILAIHNHQPVGNFENVFREAFEKCYDPFLKFLEDHSFLRVSLHYSGCLYDWFEAREKQFLKRLERLVRKDQVELLGGGYYEPILPMIPERDAISQMKLMNQYLRGRFGKKPGGFWLTERVWEQKLPRLAAQAELRYTAVDDTHFALAGLSESEIKNFFVTEEEDSLLYLFPIPKELRYLIPFREPGETLDYLRKVSQDSTQETIVTYADDGEKFGLWPGTYQWVYREGWLERFAQMLSENKTLIVLKTFREVFEDQLGRPVRKVYLPSASYEEMTEWSMSREKANQWKELKRDFETGGVWSRARTFFQGGTFKNFLAKYSEADWMRSKMNWVSHRVAALPDSPKKREAEHELWQGQCNCPYWHGVFGGLYLHHLRRSTYEHLIRAELLSNAHSTLSQSTLTEEDINQDGAKEWILSSPPFSFCFAPQRGASLVELDFWPEFMNVLDVVTRREEAYHRDLLQHKGGETGKGRSIHELRKSVSPEVLERISFDRIERLSFRDYFLPKGTSAEDFRRSHYRLMGGEPTLRSYRYAGKTTKGETVLNFFHEALSLNEKGAVDIQKIFRIKQGLSQFSVTWKIVNCSAVRLDCLWGSEWNFNFYDRDQKMENVSRVAIQDGWSRVHLEIAGEESFHYWQFPIETVAQTESDFRLIHQGISVFPHWPLSLAPKETFERTLIFSFSSTR